MAAAATAPSEGDVPAPLFAPESDGLVAIEPLL
jgi:hypothetical protein